MYLQDTDKSVYNYTFVSDYYYVVYYHSLPINVIFSLKIILGFIISKTFHSGSFCLTILEVNENLKVICNILFKCVNKSIKQIPQHNCIKVIHSFVN